MRIPSTFPVVALLVLGLAAAPAASAANPHFVTSDLRAYSGPVTTLSVDFHVAGLGANQHLEARAAGTYQVSVTCVNKAGKNPTGLQGPRTRTVDAGDVYGDQTGQHRATLTLDATPPLCPRGMDYLASSFVVDWADVTMTLLDTDGSTLDTYAFDYGL